MKHFLLLAAILISTAALAQKSKPNEYIGDTIHTKVDVLPMYPGGEDAWTKYLKKNLKYPKKAWWEEIEADVTVEFIVRYDGTITDVKNLTYAEHWGFEQEAVKAVKESNKWIAGEIAGRKVSYYAKLNIQFRLK